MVPVVGRVGVPVYRVRVWDSVLKRQVERDGTPRPKSSLAKETDVP
jgi:hypothetical protein